MNYSELKGFNFQWLIDWEPNAQPKEPDLKALDFLAKHGFNYVRIPTNYWFWVNNFDYENPNEQVFEHIDRYLAACQERDLHMSLNMHRVPGYCINQPEIEKHNLWTDHEPQDALVNFWQTWAERYKSVSNDDLSFDLINEPPHEGERGFNRDIHQKIIRRTVGAIREASPDRTIVINGIAGGHLAIPELIDLNVVHSGRGYQPMTVSHYKASWWAPAMAFDEPIYPGSIWEDRIWQRDTFDEFFQPWRDVAAQGVQVHIGECGCYDKTPEPVAKRWMTHMFEFFRSQGWGYGLWNFVGPFGIIGHARDAKFEEMDGYLVDRELLEILIG
ncbi:MAG: glycoside hydrolase family 5 protein [Fimbriimonadaceae bacterium]